MVNYLQMVNRKSILSDDGYGHIVYSLGYSKHKEFTIWCMVKNVCGAGYPLLAGCVAAVGDLRCALLCRSLVKACHSLRVLAINTDLNTSRVVLDGLLAAQLGPNRSIQLWVSGK